jgi:phosphate transport system substrate-binding protein
MMIYALVMPAVLALGLAITPAAATEATGAGSTFVYPILSRWAAEYQSKTGNNTIEPFA